MLFRLPKEFKGFPAELIEKVKTLKPPVDKEWHNKFDDLNINKNLYENLLKKITTNSVDPDELNETIANKKALEETIRKQENELLQMVNEPVHKNSVEKAVERAAEIVGNGTIILRPSAPGNYSKPKLRK